RPWCAVVESLRCRPMTPVYQTRFGPPNGNCFAACVATLLDRPLEAVDVDVSSCRKIGDVLKLIEAKAKCKIYGTDYEALTTGLLRTSERYAIAYVCTSIMGSDLSDPGSIKHGVVCEIADEGKTIWPVFDPRPNHQCRSLQDYKAIEHILFVKPL